MFNALRTKLASFIAPTNPIDAGNGFALQTRDDFGYLVAEVTIPRGGYVSFVADGREVFRIDRDGGRNI